MKNPIAGKSFICAIILSFVFVTPLLAASPTEDLKPTLEGIMAILQNPDYSGSDNRAIRREKVMEVAAQGFDFITMSKLVLGNTYATLNEKQQNKFVTLFTKLLENAYIGKLEGYENQVTKYTEEKIKGKKAMVDTLVENKGITLPVSYIMLRNDEGWKVYDIKIEGVRLLRNYKAQFESILRRDSFAGLVKVLEEKNANFAKAGSS